MTLNTYAHVIEELRGAERGSPQTSTSSKPAARIRPISGPRTRVGTIRRDRPPTTKGPGVRDLSEWAIQDSNLGPLPYPRSTLTG